MEFLRVVGTPTHINYLAPVDTTTVIYSVYDVVNNEYIQYEETTEQEDGVFNLLLSEDVKKYDRDLKIEIQSIQTNGYSEDELFVTLVRPYATADEITEYFANNFSATTSILADATTDYIRKIERKVRFLINSYINSEFKFEYKTVGTYGSNTDLLHLGQRIESFDKIIYNDYVTYDSKEDPAIDELGVSIAVAPSRYGIKVIAPGINISEWVDQNPLNNPAYFTKDSSYLVRGEYGWRHIPEDIKIAVYELINDELCADSIYANKGIKSIQNDSFNIQFADTVGQSTGNLYVDALLAPYKVWNLKAI